MEKNSSPSSSKPKFALEVQAPFSRYILDGSKSIETRSYPLPDDLLGQSIMLCESTPGIDSVSSVKDVVSAGQADLLMIGEIIVSACTEYTSQESFDKDRTLHLVHSIISCTLSHTSITFITATSSSNTHINQHSLEHTFGQVPVGSTYDWSPTPGDSPFFSIHPLPLIIPYPL